MIALVVSIVASLLCATSSAHPLSLRSGSAPTATVRNGTYEGLYSESYDQDFFLGIPYAQPPVAELRFLNPQSLNQTWSGAQDASRYSPACVGYGTSQIGYNLSEDCLYLNVIRPAGMTESLPVLVWIHGGGFTQGSGVDLRYNMSFIVERSVQIGQPIMAVTINYRLSAWGFLSSDEVTASGNSNSKLRPS
jgi:acetylcholinesterase